MKIINEEGDFWTETIDMGFWSSFKQLSRDKRDFNIIKASVLLISMRLSGIKAKWKT